MLRVLLGVVVAMLLIPSMSGAQTGADDLVLPVAGGQSDALGDVSGIDADRVEVAYTSHSGNLDVLVRLSPATSGYFGGQFNVSVGSALRNGRCSADAAADLRIEANLQWDTYYGTVTTVAGDHVVTIGPNQVVDAFPTFIYRYWSPALVGQNYRCVTGISLGADRVPEFCLGAPCPPPVSLEWIAPRDGQVVSGTLTEGGSGAQSCLLRTAGEIHRTVNYVDGQPHDQQVQAPWGCEWNTREVLNGGHRLEARAYTADGTELARRSIRVTVNNPDPPSTPAPPPTTLPTEPFTGGPGIAGTPTPSTTTAPEAGAGSIPAGAAAPGPTAGPPASGIPAAPLPAAVATAPGPRPRLLVRTARRRVLTVLERRYGQDYRRRLHETFRSTCRRVDGSTVVCGVQWSTRRHRFRGTVRIYVTDHLRHESRVTRSRRS